MSARFPPPVELTLGPGVGPDDVLAALAGTRAVACGPPVQAEWTFLDTFDARLRAAELTLTWSRPAGPGGPQLVLAGADGKVVGAPFPGPVDRVFATDLPPGLLRDHVAKAIDMRALLPLAQVRLQQRAATVMDKQDKTVVRLLFQEPAVTRPGAEPRRLPWRLRVTPVLGYGTAFAAVIDSLGSLRGVAPVKRPLRDEAVAAAGGKPEGVSARVAVALGAATPADEATIALCRRLAEVVEANLAGTLADTDTEFLHDLRVAVRRSRSVLREMRGVLPAVEGGRAAIGLRWIQEVTGATRDLDVQLLDWANMVYGLPGSAAGDLGPLHDLLTRRRTEAWRTMRRQLRGSRFREVWHAWRELLDQPPLRSDDPARPNARRPIGRVAGQRIASVYARMVKMGSVIDDDSPAESLHELRKRGKEFRYLLELYGQLWPQDIVSPMVSTMKGLQDVLGRFQDDQIQATYLRSLAPDLVATTGGTNAVIALGLIIDRLGRDQDDARQAFAARFVAFSAPGYRDLVRSTFRGRA